MTETFSQLVAQGVWQHAIIGLEGTRLTAQERRLLAEASPQGVILFARNIESPQQMRMLIEDARDAAGEYLWAAIDEEGGRVHRIPWPPFCARLPAAAWEARWREDPSRACQALREENERIGEALIELGTTHNCAPVLDLFHAHADPVIGDRAFSSDPRCVAELGVATMEGLHAAGIAAVGKHFPGHGRAASDSHHSLAVAEASGPELLAEAEPFRIAIRQGLLHLMTAHVIYPAADHRPATFSELWLKGVLRTRFAFTGTIWSDDLFMAGARLATKKEGLAAQVLAAAQAALEAGCDVLVLSDPSLWL